MRLLLATIILVLTVSCNNETNRVINQNEGPLEIDISTFTISDTSIIERIEYIPLKANHYLAGIDKLSYMNNKFYILDQKLKTLYVFSREGEILFEINDIGNGPDEFGTINDFAVSWDGIYILDNVKKKIFFIDNNGNTKQSYNMRGLVLNLGLIDSETLCLYNCYQGEHLTSLVTSFSLKTEKFNDIVKPTKDFDFSTLVYLTRNHLYNSSSTLLFNSYFTSTIYSVDGDRIRPFIEIRSDRTLSVEEKKLLSDNPEMMVQRSIEMPLLFRNVFETDDYITFEFMKGSSVNCFYSKKTSKAIFVQNIRDNRYIGNTNICSVSTKEFITYMDPSRVRNRPNLWNELMKIDGVSVIGDGLIDLRPEDTNLTLVLFELKEF